MGKRNSPSATPFAEEVIELCRLLAQMRSADRIELRPNSEAKRKTSTRDEYFAFLTLLGHRAVTSEMLDGTSEYLCSLRDFSDVPHGASLQRHALRRQPLKQGAGSLQIRGRKAFSEPIINRCKRRSRLVVATLAHRQAGNAEGDPQLPK